ncbi:ATP-binding cassette domain-containing protein [Leptotrichia sp.]|uniref:ATP-binding cassette domain-containing protein n=1 Tax=Leptotrichia sp. TaxID=104608 RepID=UPI0018036708|nr:ATP-binding cassette domain-containing protein [Leptotrichia sp.]MBB1534344.1 ATP-binding cassette domain-containing protein [Leptotrichia sp.]
MININNLKKRLNSFDLEVDLHIEKGEIFGIIGKSGSGKSTLLRIIQGIEKADVGEIFLEENTESSYIFQEFNLLYNKNVFDNVALPLILKKKKIDRKKIEKTLDFVGLLDKKSFFISELSGGEKQRVAIARALVTNPNLLLCDEVTASLDKFIQKEILELFLKINRDYGTTIILVTHELDVAKKLCDRVSVIEKGKILDTFDVVKDDIINHKSEYLEFVKEFLG